MKVIDLLKKALSHWGIDMQAGMLNEEMAELTIAVNKYRRKPNKITKAAVAEEIADVRIMLEQIELAFKITPEQKAYWRKHKLYKLERLIEHGRR